MLCEAVGPLYGLEPGKRCNANLSAGVDFDHIIADSLSGDNSLENCAAVCRSCHSFKTRTNDTPKAAKSKRVSDKHLGIKSDKPKISGRGFAKADKPERIGKASLPPRRLFK